MLSAMREMPSTASTLFSAYASFAGAIMLLRSAANDVVPEWLRSFLQSKLDGLFRTPEVSTLTLVFEESCGYIRNQVYEAAEIYLCTKVGPFTDRLKIRKTQKQKSFSIAMEKGEIVVDFYENIKLTWKFLCSESQNSEKRFFELSFEKKFREKVLDDYLPSVLARAKAIREEDKVLRLYTRDAGSFDDEDGGGVWGSIQLEHPATFETVAMDPELKKMIIDDLERFLRRKEFYKKVGKAWKRGYLLYGPPGTGKSSLIAAMANYLKFDIYDLELSSIYSNSDLRRVLVSTSNRSIIVIEDIDCTVQVRSREMEEGDDSSNPKMTLSGLLNFIDGLWSCCGDERIIIFTTNNKDILDPALLRPGRMDMHIHMSYCSLNVFRILCSNYLDITIEGHPLCVEIKSLLQDADVTPAEVAEELMRSDHPNVALGGVLNLVRRKKKERKQINEDEVKKDDGVVGEEDVL